MGTMTVNTIHGQQHSQLCFGILVLIRMQRVTQNRVLARYRDIHQLPRLAIYCLTEVCIRRYKFKIKPFTGRLLDQRSLMPLPINEPAAAPKPAATGSPLPI